MRSNPRLDVVPSAPSRPVLDSRDIYLFKEGSHTRLYSRLGCHLADPSGAHFAVWAPNATEVCVIGEWNGWRPSVDPLKQRQDGSGIWEGFVDGVLPGHAYKYRVTSKNGGHAIDKADPFAFCAEPPPAQASRAWRLDYDWQDRSWMATRAGRNALNAPISIYELHLGSWRRDPSSGPTSYRALAETIAAYVSELGFTHIEVMPVTEHPFYGSWGYQTSGYFSPTARYGSPQDFMYFVDVMHQHDIGVILDWVPAHFPEDRHSLGLFDGTHLYEHQDQRQGFHPEWKSLIFNYGRHEVRAFLISSAIFWLDRYHIDGLRVDGVASMLYLDYARPQGEWVPNRHGGNENLEAIDFLRALNRSVYREFPDVQTIAEESTAWPLVTRPVDVGGLGFGMKWNMGWMHDTLEYFGRDPIHRHYHHHEFTFSLWYAFNENFVLPLSHDEVVYGKHALIEKMPGDPWQQRANLRLLLGCMWTHPGKKLLFMGGEFGQLREWNHDAELDWALCGQAEHLGIRRWVGDLNRLYRQEPSLYRHDFDRSGFEWIDNADSHNSVVSFLRRAGDELLLVVCNFTPVVRIQYRVGVPRGGRWRELLNSDSALYGGGNVGNFGGVAATGEGCHGRPDSVVLTLPPLALVVLKCDAAGATS